MRFELLVPLVALALGGCIANVGFDPVGNAASVQGSWTIAGATPTVESCGEVRFIRLRFIDGADHRDHSELVFDCAVGSFDTRPERLVAAGAWTIALVAIREDGSVVETGPSAELDSRVEMDGHLVVPPFDVTGGG